MKNRHSLTGMRRSRVVITAIVAGLLLSVSGCSSAAVKAQPSKAKAAPVAYTTVEPGKFICSMSGKYRPFNFYDETNTLVGFDVDICNAVAKDLGLEAAPVTGAFTTLIAGLQSNRFDAIIGSMANTPERLKQVDFTEPYYSTGAYFFVKKGSSIKDAKGLKNANVGVALGTTFEKYARTLPGVSKVTTYEATVDALKDLDAGRVDVVIAQGFIGKFLAINAKLQIEAVGEVLFPDIAAIPVNKKNPELTLAINKSLAKIRSNGAYAKISIKWFGEDIS
jgi:polar amino acid transport system substrate-binding protein